MLVDRYPRWKLAAAAARPLFRLVVLIDDRVIRLKAVAG